MIEAARYINFKRYEDISIDWSPRLTVLVGPNSSGKSSLIKALLAFKQTFVDPTDHAGFITRGGYVDIGTFDEYVRDHDITRYTRFIFQISSPFKDASSNEKVFVEIVHELDPQTMHGRTREYNIYVSSPHEDININNYYDCECYIKFARMQKVEESFKVTLSEHMYNEARSKSKFVPQFTPEYDKIRTILSNGGIQAKRDNKKGMSFSYGKGPKENVYVFIYFALESLYLVPIHERLFSGLTEKIFALASLREKPARTMARTDERLVVGPTGAYTASVYYSIRERSIKAGKKKSRHKEDKERLDDWFRRLKLSENLEISGWRDMIDLRTSSSLANNKSDSIADVGVGFSQASPILVQLAAMPDETMLIVEQPELHLYPWSQTRLGEILCEEAARGKKSVIIETHSEHIIHGIQLHLSNKNAGKIDKGLRNTDVQIIYISEDAKIVRLGVDENGELISDWPDGFFDGTLKVYRTLIENRKL